MAVPRLIVGLGNPGAEHEGDRHNTGFWLVDAWLGSRGVGLRREAKFSGAVARTALGPEPSSVCWVLEPDTFMNLSGQAVAALARFYRIAAEEILVVHDELDLPPGTVRLKRGGSSTHNGLRDITARLGTPAYWRLRIGIGHPRDMAPGRDVSGYVLGRPSAADRQAIIAAIDRAIDVLPLLAADQHDRAMQVLHTEAGLAAADRTRNRPAGRPTEE